MQEFITARIESNQRLMAANLAVIEAKRRLIFLANEFVLIAPTQIGNAAWVLVGDRSKEDKVDLVVFITSAVRAEIGRTAKDRREWVKAVERLKGEDWYKRLLTKPAKARAASR